MLQETESQTLQTTAAIEHNNERRKKRAKKPLPSAGEYRGETSFFCHSLLFMLPIIGLISALWSYFHAKDKEMQSFSAAFIFLRPLVFMMYLLFFIFTVNVCMRMITLSSLSALLGG